jgi:uncharacterized protein
MQRDECDVRLSASCAHATTRDLAWLDRCGPAPAEDSADAALLQRHGNAHEARHLARLRAAGRWVVEIARDGVSLAQRAVATRAALERDAGIVSRAPRREGGGAGGATFSTGSSGPRRSGPGPKR